MDILKVPSEETKTEGNVVVPFDSRHHIMKAY